MKRLPGFISLFNSNIGQGVQQGKLVACGKAPFTQKALDFKKKLELFPIIRQAISVISLSDHGVANPAFRIGNIPVITRDYVDMGVEDCLAGGLSDIKTYIEPVRFTLLQDSTNSFDHFPQGGFFFRRAFEIGLHMPPWDHQGMAGGSWVAIIKG